MEKAERHAALLQHFVQRRENHVTHARAHLPKKSAAVSEEHPERSADCLARRKRRSLYVAPGIGHRKIEQAANERRVDRRLRRSVELQPLATFVVVDRVEPARVRDNAETDDARENRDDEIDDLPNVARLVVLLRYSFEHPSRRTRDLAKRLERRALLPARNGRIENQVETRRGLREARGRAKHAVLERSSDAVNERIAPSAGVARSSVGRRRRFTVRPDADQQRLDEFHRARHVTPRS